MLQFYKRRISSDENLDESDDLDVRKYINERNIK